MHSHEYSYTYTIRILIPTIFYWLTDGYLNIIGELFMYEFRVNYQYNRNHWTTIYYSGNPEDVYKYIEEHEEELIEAIEHPDQCIYIEQYYGKLPVAKWKGDDVSKLLLSFQYIAYPWLVDYVRFCGK